MRRLQISVDDDVDEALASEAARRHSSRAEVVRQLVREHLVPPDQSDPFAKLVGDIDDDAGDIDEVLYGR